MSDNLPSSLLAPPCSLPGGPDETHVVNAIKWFEQLGTRSVADYDDGDDAPLCVRCGKFVGGGTANFVCDRCDDMLCEYCVTEAEDSTGICDLHSAAKRGTQTDTTGNTEEESAA